jgi:hypothetical protein
MRRPWPKISEVAALVEAEPTIDDIGTARDVGDTDNATTGDYVMPAAEDLDTLSGLATAMVSGSLKQSVLRGVRAEDFVLSLMERSLAKHGSVEAAVDQLSFVPGPDDQFDGARLEVINDMVVGYDGFHGKQFGQRFRSDEELVEIFIAAGARVLAGMATSLLDRQP